MTALEDVLDRVDRTLVEVGDRFPLYADDRWRTTARGSWAAGCWVGLLWLRAKMTGSSRALRDAESWSARLECWADADTATQGLILWYGAAAGSRLGLSDVATPVALRGARSLASRFDARAGVVPWGTAFGDTPDVRARIDGVPGALPLLAWAGDLGIARAHTERHLRLCGAAPAWRWDGTTWRPEAVPPPGWSRGDAWLLLAAADAVAWLGDDFVEPAHAAADAWPGHVPFAVGADGPLDTSAAAIAAVALLKLGRRTEATAILRRLEDDHLVHGGLLNGCYDSHTGVAVDHELVWGDFFLALALAVAGGEVGAHDL
ncbi:glucuronyl hydrolase [Umezawaea endophytica]|uniref:Glucuronyl hydrolase n=1 Tax=Umezawaea endophytica TaxID=1654476 RepID=A0A9X3AE03_9PSEU|nr:glucuronyl hydrolase [Umezawaea endophytica]MCS7475425.1 glucuronyl hydrolase [Umezawaea endophytica]